MQLRSSFSSSSSSDSDSDNSIPPTTSLHTAIATLSPALLRAAISNLVHTNPAFHRALSRELSLPVPSRTYRRKALRPCANCSTLFDKTRVRREGECVYHPGELEDAVYEFPSLTPQGHSFKVVKTITMWTCCGEDGRSAGCVVGAHALAGTGGRAVAEGGSGGEGVDSGAAGARGARLGEAPDAAQSPVLQ